MQLSQGYINSNTDTGYHVLYQANRNVTVNFIQVNNISTINDIADNLDITLKLYIRYESDLIYITPGGSSIIEGLTPLVTYENLHYELVEGDQIIAEVSIDTAANPHNKISYIIQGE